jgi:hypothetical protein
MIICNFIEIMSKQSPEFLLESRCWYNFCRGQFRNINVVCTFSI